MKRVNATVTEVGQPFPAEYKATRKSDGKYYMEVRYYKRQARKWIKPDLVRLNDDVVQVYIEKVSELSASGNKV